MNNCYKVIWNEATGTTVAVAETAKGKGAQAVGCSPPGELGAPKTFAHFFIKPLVAALICIGFSFATYAAPATANLTAPAATQLPTGAQVSAGTATVSQSGAVLTVKQSSPNAALNWQTFNVGSQASVNFEQPSSQSVTLNRVLDSNPSQIFGKLSANGSVFLQNPNGVYFAPGSSVDVGSLVATTHSISDTDFMSGNYSFSRTGSTGKILNQGTLTSKLGGYIALLAPEVQNQGVVIAKGGTIVLAAGETFQLQFEANQALTNILVSPATVAAYVENGNAVMAPGGLVILSAQAANAIQGGVVKNTGSIQADGLVNDGGVIRLVASHSISNTGTITANALPGGTGSGGQITLIADLTNPSSTIHIDGTLSAQGADLGGNGGQIETSGSHVRIADGARISTEAPKGTGGSWTIDPTDFTVGTGGDISGATLGTNLTSNNVTILSSSGATGTGGNININDAVSWSGNKKLTLSADNNININNAINVPNGGSVSLVYGTGTATGDYNFGSFSANNTQFTGSINFAGTGAGLFTTQLGTGSILSYTVINNPSTYVLATNPTGGINSSSGNFALAQNYNFDRTFTASPVTGTFTGKFEGLGHTVGNLTNNGTGAIGLFNNSSGLIRDVGVNMSTNSAATGTGGLVNTNSGVIKNSFANASITSVANGTLGGLVGTNSGLITNSFSTGSISGTAVLGGLVGMNGTSSSSNPSNISNSFSTSTMTGSGNYVGGLIGENTTTGTGAASTVTNSFATGNVSTTGANAAGGLIGYNFANGISSSVAVTNSYATGNVTGPQSYGANYYFGGLIGSNTVSQSGANATVSGSYATGNVSAAASWVGGLVGFNQINSANGIADILNSYATGAVSNPAAVTGNASAGIGGLVGLNRSSAANSSSKVVSSYATGSVTGSTLAASVYSGGLIGYNFANASGVNNSVTNSFATGVVSGITAVGGLIGQNTAAIGGNTNIDTSYATGTVTGSSGSVGGLVGVNQANTASAASTSNISNSYASGAVNNTGSNNVGGLVGINTSVAAANSSAISNSYATGNVSSAGDSVGGLVGFNDGNGNSRIQQSYAMGSVESTSAIGTNVGGLVGQNKAEVANSNVSISQSYATGAVTAAKTVGGLVGVISATSGSANVDQSYATGNVRQTASSGTAGGLVGQVASSNAGSSALISNSYAVGNVTGTSSSNLGGLVGTFSAAGNGSIQKSYALGAVSGSTNMGGLIGSLSAGSSLLNNYWNTTNNPTLDVAKGGIAAKVVTAGIAGLTTLQMQDLSNFSGWDTNSVWQSLSYFNNQLPFLRQNNTLATITLVSGASVYGDTPVLSYAITNSFGNAITSPTASGTPVWALSQNGSFIGNQSISSTTNAGTYSLTYNSGISLGNYTIVSGSASNWTVGKAALGLSVTGTYSGTTSITPTSFTVTGLKNNETMVPTAVTVSDANVATANQYVTAITANTGNANFNNYDVATSFNATPNTTTTNTATLNPMALSVSAVASLSGNPYKGSAYTGTYTSSAMVPADANLISVSGVATGTDAGTYTSSLAVSLSGSALTNYSAPVITNANLVVSPKPITITNIAWTTPYDAVTAYSSLANQTAYTNTALVGSDAINTLTQTANKTGVAQAGNYSVTPSAASLASGNANNYLFSYVSANNTVSPVSLTVANSTVASKVYDGTTAASVANGSLQGVLAADASLVGLNQSGVFANPHVGANMGVTLSDTLTGAAASNYTLTQPTGLTAAITPKTLTIAGQTGANKVYDATNTATMTGGTLVGVVGSEAVGLVQAGTFASPNVGTGIAITPSNTLTGATAGNYQITQPSTLSANITPAILTVEGLAATAKVYDGTTTASLSGIAVAKPLGGGQVTINGSPVGSYQDKNVGTNKYIDVTGFSLSGPDAGNYQVTGLHGVYGDITPASLSITGLTANSKVYDATTAATFTGGAITGLMLTDVVNVNSGFFNNKNVGTGKAVTAVLTGADAGNYVATGLTGYLADVTPASLSINGQTAANKVYDATTAATLSSGTLVGLFNGDAVTLTQAGAFTNKNAGIGKSIVGSNTLAGVDAANYVLTQPTDLTATITPATLVLSGLTASNKVYNAATDASVTGAPVAIPLGNDVVTLTGTPTGVFLDKNVGNGKPVLLAGLAINNASGDGANYVLPNDIGMTANITKKDLTITGTTVATKVYDATTSATLSNGTLVGVEGSDVLSLVQTGTFNDKNVGTGKSVTPSSSLLGAANGNYNVMEPTGLTGTITQAPLSVTGLSVSEKFYDGTTSASIAGNPVAHPLLTDDVSVSGLPSAVFSNPNAGLNVPVTVSNLTLAGADAGNYSASAITGVVATIKPAVLTAVANPYSKVYDGTLAAAPTMTITGGLVGTETLNVASTGFFDAKDVLTASMVTVSTTTLSNGGNGGLASNYSLSPGQTAVATITPAQLTASVMAPNKVYNGTVAATHTLNITSGLVGSETLEVTSTASFNSKDVVTANLVTVYTASLSDGNNGGLASNYSLSPGQTVAANITPAPLTAAVTAPHKVYDGTVSATPTMTITAGLVGAETLNVSGTASFNSKNVASAHAVTVDTILLTDGTQGGLASNYSLNPGQTVAANISPAQLTATDIAAVKTIYGDPITPGAVQLAGMIGADKVSANATLANPRYSSSHNVKAGSYQQTVNALTGADASNYTLTPYTTDAPTYQISELALSGSIQSSSSTAGSILAPGLASFTNVLAGDAIGAAEVVVSIPGAAKGSKTGNSVGTFAGSQKVASLSGVDAENYSFLQVLGDYSVKTGFSSGSILPPEMRSPANQTLAVKDNSTAASVRAFNTTITPSDNSPISGQNFTVTQEAQASATLAKTRVATPTDTTGKEVAQDQWKTLTQVQGKTPSPSPSPSPAPAPAPARQMMASAKTPSMITAFAASALDFSQLGGTSDAQGPSAPTMASPPMAQDTHASLDSNDSLQDSILEFVGDVLRNPATYQVLGGASSLAVLSKTLLSSSTALSAATTPANTPNRTPVRGPYEPASNVNNRLSNRLSRRA